MHEEIVKCEWEIKDYGGEYKAQGREGNANVKVENKRCR